MKNPVFLTLWLMAVASFAAQAGHHEADKEQVVIGMGPRWMAKVKPLYAGSITRDNLAEVDRGHNDRDFDKIAAMNGDTFKVMLPNGQRIVGSDEHRALLEGWIAEANTTWEIWWMIPNKIENADGEMEEWLSSGNMLTMTDARARSPANPSGRHAVHRREADLGLRLIDGKHSSALNGRYSITTSLSAPRRRPVRA